MSSFQASLDTAIVQRAFRWIQGYFNERVAKPLRSHFAVEIPGVQEIIAMSGTGLSKLSSRRNPDWTFSELDELREKLAIDVRFFKQVVLLYRRHHASEAEKLVEKSLNPELTRLLEADRESLDALVAEEWFQRIEPFRLPRLKDYLPIQHIEEFAGDENPLLQRQHDEKFHILQAPNLFLPDLLHFRTKCEHRETPLAIAFVDIDDFKALNTRHSETKVDRNLLPRFMQTIEAHVFHHGYAYRQGGDEYLVLVPSISKPLAVAFFDELRFKLGELVYTDIPDRTTVSIGICMVDTDSPLTDREMLARANHAKNFAKESGKNRIATFRSPRLMMNDIEIVGSVR